jgi:hypothetical protein
MEIPAVRKTHKNQPLLKYTTTDNDLAITIKDQIITGTSHMYFQFDVYPNANSSATYYYSNSIASIDFNTSVFGYDFKANRKIDLTMGTSFGSVNYEKSIL